MSEWERRIFLPQAVLQQHPTRQDRPFPALQFFLAKHADRLGISAALSIGVDEVPGVEKKGRNSGGAIA
jgi:hypothetical protein